MAISAGETLSLNNLAGATGNTQGSNVSLGTIKGSPSAGDNITLSSYGVDSIGSLTGYTYAVESTNETYTLGFGGEGANFSSQIKTNGDNFTWAVTPAYNANVDSAGYLSIGINQDYTGVITVGSMNPQGVSSQTSLAGNVSHTLSVTFADGYNTHATNYNTAINKTVYSVDSYDGNSTALCLVIDSPVTLADGSVVEVGDLEEGDELRGFSIGGLGTDEAGFLDWDTDTLSTTAQNVTVENLVYSFSNRHYDINDGEIKATSEHPMLVKDASDGNYRFKEMFNISTDDKLIKEIDSVITEVDITSIEIVSQTNEIVSIDVETNDTYLVNGYITHNKGGNSHTDETAGSAPTSLAWTNGTLTLSWSGDGTNDVYDVQIDNNSDFSSPLVDETQWSETTVVTTTDGGSFDIGTGTRYARVRQYSTNGLLSNYSSTLTFTVS